MTLTKPTLFATPTTIQAVEQARSAVVLVGGYDGSGNFGDIAQLAATLGVIDRLGGGVIALPMLERQLLASHRELSLDSGLNPSLALFFDPGEGLEDDLMPVAAPPELGFGACYLYGGGYLNHRWGHRKLAMLRSAESLLASGGARRIYRLSTGLQVEAEWIAGLDDDDRSALRRFDVLGARDSESREALDGLGSTAPAVETGDDAIGLLARLPTPDPSIASNSPLVANVHFADHGWVSERPQAVLDLYVGLLAELGRLTGRQLVARPLVAYLDRRIDERPAVGRLRDSCSGLGVEFAEPLVLRPSALAEAAPELSGANLTISCSYHVALTSLMLEVPTILLGDNPYYVQKAAGLALNFGLSPAFTASTGVDLPAWAREIADCVLDGNSPIASRRRLAVGADRLRRRRRATEAELVARLGSAALIALSDQLEEMGARLRLRSTEPADLHAQLSALRTEQEELRHRADGTAARLEAERRAQEAELRASKAESRAQQAGLRAAEATAASAEAHATLETILQSRSWRLAAPLRRIAALLRRR